MRAIAVVILSTVLFLPLSVMAEACTYSEAQLAFNNGNLQRANVLMQMAARDGDKRAILFLQGQRVEYLAELNPQLAAQNK